MAKQLKIQFDAEQKHQIEAINSIIKLFDGVPKIETIEFMSGPIDEIIPNADLYDELDEFLLLDNLQRIQEENNSENKGSELELSSELDLDDGLILEGVGNDSVSVPHFTVEMETGTGKTYVYLRTIHELNKRFGYKKFIIVVPSVAIYQGVVKTIEITRSHFASLYDNEEISLIEYDGAKLGRIREYATTPSLSVMVMTIDSFNKPSNNFYKMTEQLQGEKKPFEYVQETRPIVVLDEPQNFNTKTAKEAIRTLKPLSVLRYSATHKETPNLSYRLTPVDAFRNNLVKQIEVVGISELDNLNVPLVRLLDVTRNPIAAKVKVNVLEKGIKKEKEITLKQGNELLKITGLKEYDGYKVSDINYGKKDEDKYVEFENEFKLSFNNSVASKESIFRAQIEKTIEKHMARQEELKEKGIKVLSLFFIDRVKNFTGKNAFIKKLFDESFNKFKKRYPTFADFDPEVVREGYFAKPSVNSGDEEALDTSGSNQKERQMEKAAFELIMKKKEQLLSFDEPVSFIFAHSALKEGWDNPNVFQICTLNQTVSNIKKRQEIGRGLRLAVDQYGERAEDYDVNVLTVIANESYESYVSSLQNEYIEDGNTPPSKPKKPEEATVKRNDELFASPEFQNFWSKVNKKVDFKININTEKLIDLCVEKLNATKFPQPLLEISQARFVIHEYVMELKKLTGQKTAEIEITFRDTSRNEYKRKQVVKEGDNLHKVLGDIRLRNYKVMKIGTNNGEPFVKFDNEEMITKYEPIKFVTEKVSKIEKSKTKISDDNYPIPNFIERVAKETHLTKKTIMTIFKRVDHEQKKLIFRNPEGWISEFLSQIKEVLCNHVAENIEFIITPVEMYDTEELFPIQRNFPQKELVHAGQTGLYDKVQVDSDVEREFVGKRVIPDVGNTKLYFKFPHKFKISLPKIIGNYNPDWGLIRANDNGGIKVELVRETKGGLNLEKLRFPQEKRKIRCAQKYFNELGISYRVVDQTINDWWEEDTEQQRFSFE